MSVRYPLALLASTGLLAVQAQYNSFERAIGALPFSIEPMIRTTQFTQGEGNCFLAANAEMISANGADMLLLKLAPDGHIVHDIAIGNADYHDVGMEAVQIGANLFVGGYTRSIDTAAFPTFTAFVVRLDTALNFLSQRNYILPGPMELYANTMTPTANGQLIIGGQIYDGSDFHSMLMKLDGAGNVLWMHKYEIALGERFNCIRELPGGDIMVSGNVVFGFELVLPFACKMNMNGDFIWGRYYNYPPMSFVEQSNFMFMQAQSVDDILLCGHTDVMGSGGQDFYVVNIDSSGTVNWARTYGASQGEFPYAVQYDAPTDELVMLGNSSSFSASFTPNALAMRIAASNGTLVSANLYGDTSAMQLSALTQAHRLDADARFLVGWRSFPADDIYVAGLSNDLDNTCNVYTVNPAAPMQTTTTGPFTAIVTSPAVLVNDLEFETYSFAEDTILCESAMGMGPLPLGTAGLSVMPNPASHDMTLVCDDVLHASDRVEVMDAQGRVVRTQRGEGRRTLTVVRGGLDAGAYTVRVIREDAIHVVRVVLE